MKNALPVLFLLLTVGALPIVGEGRESVPRHNPSSFTPPQWTAAFAAVAGRSLPERIGYWGDLLAIDSVYILGPLGEGPGRLPDSGPLYDFTHLDCVTYVEHVYALALSTNRQQFDDTLRRIRYRDGKIEFRWRNHYTVADWLPANAWFIRDVTGEIGAGHTLQMTKTISRAHFFAQHGLPQYAGVPDEECTTAYLPRDAGAAMASKLRSGDMIIFVLSTPGIIAGHTGIIRVKKGVPQVQNASQTEKKVITVPLVDCLRHLPARFVGFKIARPFKKDEG